MDPIVVPLVTVGGAICGAIIGMVGAVVGALINQRGARRTADATILAQRVLAVDAAARGWRAELAKPMLDYASRRLAIAEELSSAFIQASLSGALVDLDAIRTRWIMGRPALTAAIAQDPLLHAALTRFQSAESAYDFAWALGAEGEWDAKRPMDFTEIEAELDLAVAELARAIERYVHTDDTLAAAAACICRPRSTAKLQHGSIAVTRHTTPLGSGRWSA